MTEQERKEIIEVLDFQRSQFSKEAPRLNELIKAMRKLNCERALDELTKLSIKDLVRKCCDIVGYEITEANNACRHPILIEQRRAVIYFVWMVHDYDTRLFTEVGGMLGKDRTNVSHHANKAQVLIDNKDKVFDIHYSRLVNHDFNQNN